MVGRRTAVWIVLAGLAAYSLFVGTGVSVVRAAVMDVLVIVAATMLGRPRLIHDTFVGKTRD